MDDAVTPPPAPQPAAPPPAPAPEPSAAGDGFDRVRVLEVVARIERDVALVEQAMTSLEAGEHRAAESALSVLEAGTATG